MNGFNDKKILVAFVLVALIGGIFGSIISSQPARAGFFGDLYNQYVKPFVRPMVVLPPQEKKNASQAQIYAPTNDYEQAVVRAIEQASPAVVSIVISKNLPVIEQCPYDPFAGLPPDVQQFFGGGQGSQFYQPCQKGTKLQEIGGGSGFIVSPDGLIATNKHVVYDEKASYTALTNDGKKYDAKVLARDPNRDVALIKISAENLPVITLGDSDGLKLGQTAIAIGNALGEFRNTVSMGVVSGLSRSITAQGAGIGSEALEGLIQTDAAINEGNSGGPLLNLKGEVIGINVAMVSGAQSVGFSIPINQVKQAINSVKNTGRIISPYLGVRYLVIDSDLAKKEKLPVEEGVLARGSSEGAAVIKNSPADKAGIKAEDIITEVNGQKITKDNSLTSLLQKYNVGDTITLKVLRDGKEMDIKAVLEERPSNI